MRTVLMMVLAVVLGTAVVLHADPQRFPFERSFDAVTPSRVDVTTLRGKIDVVAGEPGRIVVMGEAAVRIGWNVPADAVEIARQVAASPPVIREGDTLRLQPPAGDEQRRAVTLSYRIRVPPNTEVVTNSDSGATSIRGVAGAVRVRTQSAAIDLNALGHDATVSTQSGAVTLDGIAGTVSVTTGSSGINGRGLGSSLRIRTQSGQVTAALERSGDVDVETGSSAIRLRGVRGGLIAKSQSGRVTVQGVPQRPWNVTTGSSAVDLEIEADARFSVEAASRSGSVDVQGRQVQGSVTRHAVYGTVGGGGPEVRINSGSGSIRVHVGGR